MLSPSLNRDMMETCNRYGKLAVPGVLTPTEIQNAYEMGAQLVKIFPASTFGPSYIRQIKGPMDHIRIMAVGGISQDNVQDYLSNGADCVGVGGEIANLASIRKGDFSAILENAKGFTEKI